MPWRPPTRAYPFSWCRVTACLVVSQYGFCFYFLTWFLYTSKVFDGACDSLVTLSGLSPSDSIWVTHAHDTWEPVEVLFAQATVTATLLFPEHHPKASGNRPRPSQEPQKGQVGLVS